MVFEYCDTYTSSANFRTYIHNHLEGIARKNPHVEFVVKQRPNKEPVVRGFYINNRDKVICLKGLEVNGIEKKVELLLDSSGAKIKPLKRRIVESRNEAARVIQQTRMLAVLDTRVPGMHD
ncbi:thioredoxin-like protein [Epithele typhae]|uniref:thioredoxin-like protein n=1 Tax=Epithele typhae TaxID=378194 RepID=UPI002008866E|nr:thioredoxin-like protein [Epithele typhae]KAH9927516.1 thioredoxin-like protein [Epithele typhae]